MSFTLQGKDVYYSKPEIHIPITRVQSSSVNAASERMGWMCLFFVSKEKCRGARNRGSTNQLLSRGSVMQRWRARAITTGATAAVAAQVPRQQGAKRRSRGGEWSWTECGPSEKPVASFFGQKWTHFLDSQNVTVLAQQGMGRHCPTMLKHTDTVASFL